MFKKIAFAAAALTLFASPALAAHCPADAKAIEAALPSSSLSAAEKAEVTSMKDQGMKLHSAGKHRESEAILAKAMRKLLLAK